MNKLLTLVTSCCLLLWSGLSWSEDTTQVLVDQGKQRLEQNQSAQKKVDSVYENTRDLVEDYQARVKVVDGLEMYNKILRKQLDNQEVELANLDNSIANAAVIERQILPLLSRMLDGLENFVSLDIPFLINERSKRVEDLRMLISRSGLTNAEKTRRVFEAFQIENEYGYTIESYKGKLNLDSKTFDVDYLRVGRASYTYRSVGAGDYGYWDGDSKTWADLKDNKLKRHIDKGIKMAKQELAPELLTIPLASSMEVL